LYYDKRNNTYCSNECRPKSDRGELYEYRQKCKFKFNLADYPNGFDFNLIKEHGWYKASNNGNNLNGVVKVFNIL
jgi:hypothetical protein